MSTSAAAFSRGRPVYGGGGFAPNRGQVSAQGAQGYMQREIKKRNTGPFGGVSTFGSDGMSNTRSGVAARALASSSGQRPGPDNGGTPPHGYGNTGGPKIPDNGGSTPPNQGGTGGTTGGTVGGSGNGAGGSSNGGGSQQPPPPPQVVVDANGQLQLPYDQQFSSEVLSALDKYNSDLLQLQFDSQAEGLQYAKDRRDTDVNYEDTKRATLSGNAARGTAFSSNYGVAASKDARNYQNKINDLDSSHSLFGKFNELKRAGIITAFQRMLAQAALDYGNRLDDDAGDLGLGNGTTTTPVTGPGVYDDQHKYWPTNLPTGSGPRGPGRNR